MSSKQINLKIRIFIFMMLIFSSCTESGSNHEVVTSKLHNVETKFIHFQDLNISQIDPCDSFSLEVEHIYPDVEELPPAHLDTAFLDNDLKRRGFKTINSGWGNFEDGPRMLSIELSNKVCRCTVYKKYSSKRGIGENGISRIYYTITERMVCNALNNAVQ